jgi:predicted nucleotidyltransferase
MDQDRLIQHVTAALGGQAGMKALFLSGSFAKGSADPYSDVDFAILVDPNQNDDFQHHMHSILEDFGTIIYWVDPFGNGMLFNIIFADWLRCDVLITDENWLKTQSQASVRALIDPGNLFASLPERLPYRGPNKRQLANNIQEFIRVLGLAAVVVGREELIVANTGLGLQRTQLINLMLEELELADPGGALHLNPLLPPADRTLLEQLPGTAATMDEATAAHMAYARIFLPRAKALALKHDLPWPEEFLAATLKKLETDLGVLL